MIKYQDLQTAWHVRDADSGLLSMLVGKDPGVDKLLAEFQQRCPVAESCRPFEDGAFHRMKGHVRSFAARTSGGGVVVVKGTEPMSKDYLEICDDAMRARPFCMMSKVDWFLLIENEPFLGQSLSLALNYAKLSLEFTAKYVARFGILPKIPFPIAVFKIPEPAAEEFKAKTRPYASDRPQVSSRVRLDELIAKGLGVFVYYYPGTPLRAAHARGMFPGSHEAGSFQDVKQVDFRSAIDGWLELTAEMLVLGYLPTAHIHQGNCMQAQNLCIDGGMCDIDSIEPMSNVVGDKLFLDALFYSLFVLAGSISSVVSNKAHHVDQVVWAMVWSELSARVKRKANGDTDPRLLDMLRPMNLDLLFDPRMMHGLQEMRTTPVGII